MDLKARERDCPTAEELEPLNIMEPNSDAEKIKSGSEPVSSPYTTDSIHVIHDELPSSRPASVIYEMTSEGSQLVKKSLQSTNKNKENLNSTNPTSDTGQSENNSVADLSDDPSKTGVTITIIPDDNISMISSIQGDMCRICHCVAEENETLISPCACCGSMKWVHQQCLQEWVKSSDTRKCELCGYPFNMTSSVKPFRKWSKLNMSSVERRKVLCSVTFHVVAITCVIWSLYVLIDRTTQEIQDGELNWPFWTKLVVVAIGFTGGVVFMYVQCKMYVQLFKKWKQFNRVIYINEISTNTDLEKQAQSSPSTSVEPSTSSTNSTSASWGNVVKHDIVVSYVAST